MTTSTRHGEVSIHIEDPDILSVMQVLSKTVEEFRLEFIIIIIIMWLVQSWTLPFLRACSMPVDSALGGRRLLAQC